MSSLPTNPSKLAPFTSNPHLRAIVEGASNRYAEHLYATSLEVIAVTNGDGMTRHSEFNRSLASGFKRAARRAGWNWELKHDTSLPFVGDLVHLEKHKGQLRFAGQLENRKFRLLHMTGKVSEADLKVKISMEISPARQQYLQIQNPGVVRHDPPHLFNRDDAPFDLLLECDDALNILIITEKRGLVDVRVYAALPVGYWEEDDVIPLAELEHLFDVPVQKTKAAPAVKPKRAPETDLDITVSKK